MKVSVCMITYNHEQFIKQAVASALQQVTGFEYEIVIGEDCSTDRTRDILVELQQANPDKIRLLLRDRNLGGQLNFVQTLSACRGEYIAYLEGDDYWTSSAKLQKQVDFLDQHSDFAICFHNALKFYADGGLSEPICADDQPAVSTIEDMLRKNFIPACSVMFRNKLFESFPDWFFSLKLGDWPLHILNAQYGKIGYINEVMAVYRIHRAAAWSALAPDRIIDYTIEMLRHVNAHFGYKYQQAVELAVDDLYRHWAWQIIAGQITAEGAQAILDRAGEIDPEAPARLLMAIAVRGAELDHGKVWLTQQCANWQAEAERREQNSAQQSANWQNEVKNLTAIIDEHKHWIQQLEQGKAWLSEQRNNWQSRAEELISDLGQLQQAHDQLAERVRLCEERRLSRQLHRVRTHIGRLMAARRKYNQE